MQSRREFFKSESPSRLKAMEDSFYRWRKAAIGSVGDVDIPTEDEIDCLFVEFLLLATGVHHYNRLVSPQRAVAELVDPRGANKSIAMLRGKTPQYCAESGELSEVQNRMIESLASSLKSSNDLIETMSKAIFQKLKQEKTDEN